jgi:hypothetical protein
MQCKICDEEIKESQKILNLCLSCKCSIERIIFIETDKKSFWYNMKDFAYHFILYLIPCVFIAYKWGLTCELSFVTGTIWLSLMPIIKRFFMKIF